MRTEPCTYAKTQGGLGDAAIHYCDDCGYQVEVRRGKRFMVFEGVREIDMVIKGGDPNANQI